MTNHDWSTYLTDLSTIGRPVRRADGLLYVSAQLGRAAHGELVREYADLDAEGQSLATEYLAVDSWSEPLCAQLWQALCNVEAALRTEGADRSSILRINVYSRQMHQLDALNRVRIRFFSDGVPCNTHVEVSNLLVPGALVMVEAVAAAPVAVPDDAAGTGRVLSQETSQLVGEYALGMSAGPYLFASGAIAASNDARQVIRTYADFPAAQEYAEVGLVGAIRDEEIVAQTAFIYQDLLAALRERGQDRSDVARLTIFVKQMSDINQILRIHQLVFGDQSPAVVVQGVTELGHHDFRLEIEMIAAAYGPAPRFEPRPSAVRGLESSHPLAARLGGLAFTSGIVGAARTAPRTDREWQAAAASSVDRLEEAIGSLGGTLADIRRLNVHLPDPTLASPLGEALQKRFGGDMPAVTALGVRELADPTAIVQFDTVAELPSRDDHHQGGH